MLRFGLILSAIRLGVAMLRKFRHPEGQPQQGPMTDDEVEQFLIAAADNVKDAPDWRKSVVDLLKILRQDSSYRARSELWAEMGHEVAYGGSAEQNVQLHKDVTKKIAERELVVP
jgi:uncharacterized protein DUF3597